MKRFIFLFCLISANANAAEVRNAATVETVTAVESNNTKGAKAAFYDSEFTHLLKSIESEKIVLTSSVASKGNQSSTDLGSKEKVFSTEQLLQKFSRECGTDSELNSTNKVHSKISTLQNGLDVKQVTFSCRREESEVVVESGFVALYASDSDRLLALNVVTAAIVRGYGLVKSNSTSREDRNYLSPKTILVKTIVGTALGAYLTNRLVPAYHKSPQGDTNDKAVHSIIGSVTAVAGMEFADHVLKLCPNEIAAAGLIAAAGVSFLKEVWDKVSKTGTPDIWDFSAGTFGGAVTVGLFAIKIPFLDDPTLYKKTSNERGCRN